MTANASNKIQLVYDGRCPVCRTYCTRVALDEAAGEIELVDARKDSAIMDEITAAGLDIDQGMVVKKDGKLHYGAEAMTLLARLQDSKGGLVNRLGRLSFINARASAILYPVGKAVRNLVLKALRIPYIKNLERRS